MKLKHLIEELGLTVVTGHDKVDIEVTGGYASDLLSDVIANSKEGNIWLTLQTHQNIVAVAKLKDLSGIIIVNNRQPDEATIKKAKEEKIPVFRSELTTFELAGRIYQLGIKS
ncbi:MAG: DRTGG domain-containing protein [Candidatus Aminicenantia bacterium]